MRNKLFPCLEDLVVLAVVAHIDRSWVAVFVFAVQVPFVVQVRDLVSTDVVVLRILHVLKHDLVQPLVFIHLWRCSRLWCFHLLVLSFLLVELLWSCCFLLLFLHALRLGIRFLKPSWIDSLL